MKNIVLKYHFLNDQVGYIVLNQKVYNEIKKRHPDYKDVLTDETINPFGHQPTYIKVELWEDADLVEVKPESGSLESVLGLPSMFLVGDFLGHLETI